MNDLLIERMAAALTAPSSSDTLKSLLDEVTAAPARAEKTPAETRALATDPKLMTERQKRIWRKLRRGPILSNPCKR